VRDGGRERWREPVALWYHCSTAWAVFLLNPRSLRETGEGARYPDEIKFGDIKFGN
jgi:hypothetical protein